MRIGLALAQIGHFADAEQLRAMAVGAEQRGYASLWALDRLLTPVSPRSAYPGNPEGLLPAGMAVSLDPLMALAAAASVTSTIRVGTNILVAPWYQPVLLARSLASLDVLSGGRLEIGLGLGWSRDEYDAVGVPQRELGERLDDLIHTLDALWQPGAELVHHEGRDFHVVPSSFRPGPVQRPRPPITLAAYTPAGLSRVGRLADGWTPAGLDLATTAAMWEQVKVAAVEHGRDPDVLRLVVRANAHHTLVPLADGRPTFHGSVDQIAEDVRGAMEIGAADLILDLQSCTSGVEEYLDVADRIRAAAAVTTADAGRAA